MNRLVHRMPGLALLGFVLPAAVIAPAPAPAPAPAAAAGNEAPIRLVSPADHWWVGPVTFIAQVQAPRADPVREVEFFLDGRWLGTLQRPPWQVKHEIGGPARPHALQVLARLLSGQVLAQTFDTSTMWPAGVQEEAGVELVLVPVVVADANGIGIRGLGTDDFEVEDGGVRARVVSVDTDPPPGSVVLALDYSGSMQRRFALEQAAAIGCLKSIPEGSDIAVVRFGTKVETLAEWTRERRHVVYAVNAPADGADSTTALLAAVRASLDLIEARPGRAAVVFFTDGEDSEVPAEDVDAYIHGLIARARLVPAAVYAVLYGPPRDGNPLVLIARETGGEVYQAGSGPDLRAAYARLKLDLLPPYVLGIAPSRDGRAGDWRGLEVRLTGELASRATILNMRRGYVRQ